MSSIVAPPPFPNRPTSENSIALTAHGSIDYKWAGQSFTRKPLHHSDGAAGSALTDNSSLTTNCPPTTVIYGNSYYFNMPQHIQSAQCTGAQGDQGSRHDREIESFVSSRKTAFGAVHGAETEKKMVASVCFLEASVEFNVAAGLEYITGSVPQHPRDESSWSTFLAGGVTFTQTHHFPLFSATDTAFSEMDSWRLGFQLNLMKL